MTLKLIFLQILILCFTLNISCSSEAALDDDFAGDNQPGYQEYEELNSDLSEEGYGKREEGDGKDGGFWVIVTFVLVFSIGIIFILFKILNPQKEKAPPPTHSDFPHTDTTESSESEINEQYPSTEESQLEEELSVYNLTDATDAIHKLNARIRSIEDLMETTAILRLQKEKIEDDLKNYINGYNFSMLSIALNDLIESYEFTIEAEEMLEKRSSTESNELKGYLTPISMYLKQGLEMAGVEQFTPEIGTSYQQTPGCSLSGKLPTTNKDSVGCIASVEKPGWKTVLPADTNKQEILRNAQVTVFVLTEE
tara:strand:- start:1167 stop:2096 length:930 start_codon:yes stop_codon:yes gene_type:complete